jgi:hypothetical protein
VSRTLERYQDDAPVGLEAVCYGHLHPTGQRMPASAFGRDPDRVNGLTELCLQCNPNPIKKEATMTKKTCKGCGVEKDADQYYTGCAKCKSCVLAAQKVKKAAKAGKTTKAKPAPVPAPAPKKIDRPPMSAAEFILAVLMACGKITQRHIDAAKILMEDA